MGSLANVFLTARKAAGLDDEHTARLVGLDATRVHDLEENAVPSPLEIDAYATAFGVEPAQFVKGGAEASPVARLLFRCATEGMLDALEDLLNTENHQLFGDFLRCVSTLAGLRSLLGTSDHGSFPKPPAIPRTDTPPYGANELAAWLRAELGLGNQPISSMRGLLQDLGVPVFFVSRDEFDASVDGASTSSPLRAVLVNLAEGPDCWWRTRMTLAHELCHLLVDHRSPDEPRFTVSPYGARQIGSTRPARRKFAFHHDFDFVERRAGAFAACLLAPDVAVREVVDRRDPTSEAAIEIVGEVFAIGRTAACYRLKHVYRLGDYAHWVMLRRGPVHWPEPNDHPDRAPREIGLRAGVLRDLALTAFATGVIDAVQVREHLRLPFSEPLPYHRDLSEEQRAPLRRIEDTVQGIAQHFVEADLDEPDLVVGGHQPIAGGWDVKVLRGDSVVGRVFVPYDLEAPRYSPTT